MLAQEREQLVPEEAEAVGEGEELRLMAVRWTPREAYTSRGFDPGGGLSVMAEGEREGCTLAFHTSPVVCWSTTYFRSDSSRASKLRAHSTCFGSLKISTGIS